MVALLVSYVVIAYLLIPSAIFRASSFFIPLKKFKRSRTEEITFAVWTATLPSVLACLRVSFFGKDLASWNDYQHVLAGCYSENAFDTNQALFWESTVKAFAGQERFLLWYYLFAIFQAAGFVALVQNYGRWRERCWLYERFASALLRNVSEWHLLLSTFNFPPNPAHEVAADILTTDDHLYQGIVREPFLDADGALSGLVLIRSRRFDRTGYLDAKKKEPSTNPDNFWKILGVPDNILYLPSEKIVSLNLRYPLREAAATDVAAAATEILRDLKLTVEPADSETGGVDDKGV